jgi:hypothetical protein
LDVVLGRERTDLGLHLLGVGVGVHVCGPVAAHRLAAVGVQADGEVGDVVGHLGDHPRGAAVVHGDLVLLGHLERARVALAAVGEVRQQLGEVRRGGALAGLAVLQKHVGRNRTW